MKLIIIHGNGLSAISQKISLVKKNFDKLSVIELSGKSAQFEKTLAELSTPSLFANERLVILEDIDEKLNFEKLPTDDSLTIILRFSKALPKTSAVFKTTAQAKPEIILFSEEQETNIFPFLDKLSDKNTLAMREVDQLLDEFGGQYLLTMIFYMLRRLVVSPQKLPSFVAQKIAKQKRNFPNEKINELYKKTIETDFKIKKGLVDERMGLTLLVNNIVTQ